MQYCVCLFRGENHRFVLAGGLTTDEAHRVRLLSSWNQPVTLAVLVDERHKTPRPVERWIAKTFLDFQGLQPFNHCSTSSGSTLSATRFPQRGNSRLRSTRS